MGHFSYGYGVCGRPKKRWRYPGVPIPFRLRHRYTP
jgi:hypothetical protein